MATTMLRIRTKMLVLTALLAGACAAPPSTSRDDIQPTKSVPIERADAADDDDDAQHDGDPIPSPMDGGDGDASPQPQPQPTATKKLAVLTGTQTSSGKFGVGGTDLGIPVRQPNGKIAFIFGDTFENDGIGGPGWRAPVLLRSEAGDYKNGITFTSAAGGTYAKQLLAYSHANSTTFLPGDAITIGNRMYLQYMVNQPLGNVSSTGIAYSDDNGENWVKSNATWSGDANSGLRQLWTWERGGDGFVYTLTTKFDRQHPILLFRVPEDKLLEPSAYVPWGYKGGQWAWGNPATPVLSGKFGEMCLRRIEGKWVLSFFNAAEYNITVLVFDTPTSNLYQAKKFVPITGAAWGAETDTSVAQLYGGYIHPDSTLLEMYLIVSQWNTKTNKIYRSMEFVTGVDVN